MNLKFTYELNRVGKKKRGIRSGNEMINSNDRLNRFTKAELTAHLRELSKEKALDELNPGDCAVYETTHAIFSEEHPCHIGVIVCPPTNRRMDAPNWYPTVKALVDGLTDAGVFDDDNNKVVTSMTFIPGPKTENKKYRIELHIQEGADPSWQI